MKRLACIFLHMDSLDADFLYDPFNRDLNKSVLRQRPIVLRNLISLWQVRIEVILASPLGLRIHSTIQAKRGTHGESHRHTVENRQCAGKA